MCLKTGVVMQVRLETGVVMQLNICGYFAR